MTRVAAVGWVRGDLPAGDALAAAADRWGTAALLRRPEPVRIPPPPAPGARPCWRCGAPTASGACCPRCSYV